MDSHSCKALGESSLATGAASVYGLLAAGLHLHIDQSVGAPRPPTAKIVGRRPTKPYRFRFRSTSNAISASRRKAVARGIPLSAAHSSSVANSAACSRIPTRVPFPVVFGLPRFFVTALIAFTIRSAVAWRSRLSKSGTAAPGQCSRHQPDAFHQA
jgi:hypothetical protein